MLKVILWGFHLERGSCVGQWTTSKAKGGALARVSSQGTSRVIKEGRGGRMFFVPPDQLFQ